MTPVPGLQNAQLNELGPSKCGYTTGRHRGYPYNVMPHERRAAVPIGCVCQRACLEGIKAIRPVSLFIAKIGSFRVAWVLAYTHSTKLPLETLLLIRLDIQFVDDF